MEGSTLNKVIGVGTRVDKRTGGVRPVFDTYPSYYTNVVQAFVDYPIAKYFGLNYEDAMNLPVDQWYHIRDAAVPLVSKDQKPDTEAQLMKIIEQFLLQQSQKE